MLMRTSSWHRATVHERAAARGLRGRRGFLHEPKRFRFRFVDDSADAADSASNGSTKEVATWSLWDPTSPPHARDDGMGNVN